MSPGFNLKMLFGMLMMVSLLGIVSCSCSKTDTVNPKPSPTSSVVVPPIPTTQLVESLKASVTIPLSFKDEHADSVDSPNYRLFSNRDSKELLSLDAETVSSSYEEYVLEAIRSLKDRGAMVQSTNKVFINNIEMTVLESSTQGVVAWFWITTKNGIGYTFTCGGLETSITIQDTCNDLAKSFKIQ